MEYYWFWLNNMRSQCLLNVAAFCYADWIEKYKSVCLFIPKGERIEKSKIVAKHLCLSHSIRISFMALNVIVQQINVGKM